MFHEYQAPGTTCIVFRVRRHKQTLFHDQRDSVISLRTAKRIAKRFVAQGKIGDVKIVDVRAAHIRQFFIYSGSGKPRANRRVSEIELTICVEGKFNDRGLVLKAFEEHRSSNQHIAHRAIQFVYAKPQSPYDNQMDYRETKDTVCYI